MGAIFQHLQAFGSVLACSSFYGTILFGIILLIRWMCKKRLRFRMVYWLWMLLLVRLVWPLHLEAGLSLFNLLPREVSPQRVLSPVPAKTEGATEAVFEKGNMDDFQETDSEPSVAGPIADRGGFAATKNTVTDWKGILCGIWLAVGAMLGMWILWNHFRLWRIVKQHRLVTRQDILELLEDCKDQLGLQTVVGIVETGKVSMPCLFGYLRPRLLLPKGTLDELDAGQLRYVFLHELAHLKRHDILMGWFMAIVQVLHWFNPAVWLAMSMIHADRELACDELALSRLKTKESQAYGATILTFLERFARSRRLPAMAGIAENPSLLKRRIAMITMFKKQKVSYLPVVAIISVLAVTTFTSAHSMREAVVETVVDSVVSHAVAAVAKPVPLGYDDGKSAGRSSISGSGHAVYFEPEEKSELVAVMLYGSRYGANQPPAEKFHIYLCDVNQNVIEDFELSYGTFKKGNPKWVKMRVKNTVLPDQFYLCFGFNAEQTKGVYVHHDGQGCGRSYTGLPANGFSEFDGGDWMIRAVVRPLEGAVTDPVVSSSASDGLQAMIDAAAAGSIVTVPAGVYEQPITINKSLQLYGESAEGCILKVTADEPAILVDTQGKGKVEIRDLTIQWQLASSEQHEMPFAVAVKDSEVSFANCCFQALGNPQRSPVGMRSMGFSKMNVQGCDFTGFDYVVCYGQGTSGTLSDSFIRDCGHQGVIAYQGASIVVSGNIITGSKYHAVRVTGGKLDMHDNLIIKNRNRGVYLGNKSGSGQIFNNLLIDNGTGIDGTSACRFKIQNNVILKSGYAAIAARPYSTLVVRGNVLSDGPKGIIIHQEEGKNDPVKSIFVSNVFWKNQSDLEACECPEMIVSEPQFVEPGNGNFTLTDPAMEGIGLKDPKAIFDLWQIYQAGH